MKPNDQDTTILYKDIPENLKSIPTELRSYLEDYLNSNGVTDYQIENLISDPDYSFSALDELFKREDLNYKDLIDYVYIHYPHIKKPLSDFLLLNGVIITDEYSAPPEKTLREVLKESYSENISSLLILYTQELLRNVSSQAEDLMDMGISKSSSQLSNIVESLLTTINNIEQIRSLELIRNAIEPHIHTTTPNQSNVLTEEERLEALPDLKKTQDTYDQFEDSLKESVFQLADVGAHKTSVKYVFKSDYTPFSKITQKRLNFLNDIFGFIDKDKNTTNYNNYLTEYFDSGGWLMNKVLGEEIKRTTLKSYFHKAFYDKFTQETPLNKDLAEHLADLISEKYADKSFGIKGTFNNLLEFTGAIISAIFGEKREKGYESVIETKNAKDKVTDAQQNIKEDIRNYAYDSIDNGYTDRYGNYHSPVNLSAENRAFLANNIADAGYSGLADTAENLKLIPHNYTDGVSLFPFGDFHSNPTGEGASLGTIAALGPNGIAHSPLNYSVSPEKHFRDALQDKFAPDKLDKLENHFSNNAELYKGNSLYSSAFSKDGNFKNLDIPDHLYPYVQDAAKTANIREAFNNADGNFFKNLAVPAKSASDFINNKLGLPIGDNLTQNLLQFAGAPLSKPAELLGKAGVPFLPGNPQFNNTVFGPQALANKLNNRPFGPNWDNYSPQTLNNLNPYMARANPAQLKGTKYSPEQMQQMQNYQRAMQKKNAKQAGQPQEAPQQKQRAQPSFGDNLASGIANLVKAAPGITQTAHIITPLGLAEAILTRILGTAHNPVASIYAQLGEYLGFTGATAQYEIDQESGKIRLLEEEGRNYGPNPVRKLFGSDWRFNLYNNTLGKIPLFGKAYRASKSQIQMGMIYNPIARHREYGNMIHAFQMLAEATPGSDPKQQLYLESAAIAKKLHRVFYFYLTDQDYRIMTGAGINAKDRKRNLFQMFSEWNGYRNILGSYTSTALGLLRPLRSDFRVVDTVSYILNTLPSSVIQVVDTTQSLIRLQPRFIQDYISKIMLGGRAGAAWRWLFNKDSYVKKSFFGLSVQYKKKSVYSNTLTRAYFGTVGRFGKFLSFLGNPAAFIQNKIRSMFFNMIKFVAKEIAIRGFRLFIKLTAQLSLKLGSRVVGMLLGSFGVGCILLALLSLISIITIGGIVNTNVAAFGTGGGKGAETGNIITTSPLACSGYSGNEIEYVKVGSDGKDAKVTSKAVILDVPYFNQVVLDPKAANDPEKAGKIANGKIQGGGNMCGAASVTMIAGFYKLIPQDPAALQDYMYMDKFKGAFNISYPDPSGCTSSDGNSTQSNIKGAFFFTGSTGFGDSGRRSILCDQSYFDGLAYFLSKLNLSMVPIGSLSKENMYSQIRESIKKGNPLMMSLTAPVGHLNVIVGYTYEGSEDNVTAVVVNDPYADLQYDLDNGQKVQGRSGSPGKRLAYGEGGTDRGANKVVYRLDDPKFSIQQIWKIVPNGEVPGRGVACIPSAKPGDGSDKIVASVWQHSQNYTLSCEIASLATTLKAVNVDLGKNKQNGIAEGNIIRSIEEEIINKYIPNSKSDSQKQNQKIENGKIVQWDDPEEQFVGKVDGAGLNFNLSTSPNVDGYGTHAKFIDKIAKDLGVKSTLLKGNRSDIAKLYSGIDAGHPAVIWVPTEFESLKDPSKITDTVLKGHSDLLEKNVQNNYKDFVWKTPSGKEVEYIPHEHAVVLYGYNPTKKLVYIMDVYKNRPKTSNLPGTDSPNITSAKVTLTEEEFLRVWSYINYQAVIIEGK